MCVLFTDVHATHHARGLLSRRTSVGLFVLLLIQHELTRALSVCVNVDHMLVWTHLTHVDCVCCLRCLSHALTLVWVVCVMLITGAGGQGLDARARAREAADAASEL
jgi:hypothetical protein